MSNPFRSQIENLINAKLGTNTNRMTIGIVTKVDTERYICSVCPIDMDAMWEMKKYYAKTKIDKMAAQNIIENISLKNSKTIKAADIQKGDRVVIGYDEDLPYIVQRIKQSSVLNQKISGSEEDISVYEWLGENFGEIKEINPIPGMSMDGV